MNSQANLNLRAKYGEGSNAWRVRVLGEFPTADDETVIPLELVLSAVERRVSSLSYYPVLGGRCGALRR